MFLALVGERPRPARTPKNLLAGGTGSVHTETKLAQGLEIPMAVSDAPNAETESQSACRPEARKDVRLRVKKRALFNAPTIRLKIQYPWWPRLHFLHPGCQLYRLHSSVIWPRGANLPRIPSQIEGHAPLSE
jgi:hypothetical protein